MTKKLTNFGLGLLEKALNYHSTGNIVDASKYYQTFLDKGFLDPRAFINYGVICKQKGQLDKAKNLYKKAIKIYPDCADSYSNLGLLLRDEGQLVQAEMITKKAIKHNPNFANAYSNLGLILIDQGKLEEAKFFLYKAIEINFSHADAHANLGAIFKMQGKLLDAELFIIKSIEFNPFLATSYYVLSTLKKLSNKSKWENTLFSNDLLERQNQKNKISIYFARANVLHTQGKYNQSSEYLLLANKEKLKLNPSNILPLIKKTKELFLQSNQYNFEEPKGNINYSPIFIVGMPRSGSTLIESIITMRKDVSDLGEINIFEEMFVEWNNNRSIKSAPELNELYFNKINSLHIESTISTNKWLYNYQYVGVISRKLPSAKIIYCHRNPLDNILSIYRAYFAKGNSFSSSLSDCAKIYLDHDQIMTKYKNLYSEKIYDLNYDLLAARPDKEIRALISWLGWDWDDLYLSPNLNNRSINTRSNVEVRYPINSKSIGTWKNYRKLLEPSIEILTQNHKYKYLSDIY